MEESILKFIEEFKYEYVMEFEDVFYYRLSYYFAIILHERFDHRGTIMYIPRSKDNCLNDEMFCYKIDDILYSIYGKIEDEEKIKAAKPWNRYNEEHDCEDIIKRNIMLI